MPLILGTDIEFEKIDRNKASFHFKVLNQEAVDHFLENKELMKFLRDPYTSDKDCGCRMEIEQKDDMLIIGRQMKSTTIAAAAIQDALSTMATYIMPDPEKHDFGAWADMVGGDPKWMDQPHLKTLERGETILAEAKQEVENKDEWTEVSDDEWFDANEYKGPKI